MKHPLSWMNRLFPIMLMADGEGEGGGSGDGEGDGAWAETLPESVREWDEVKNSDSPDKFWDQMSNMRSRMGRSIIIPGEDAGDEQWSDFHQKLTAKVPNLMPVPNSDDEAAMGTLFRQLGQPEKAEEYKVPELDGQGMELDTSMAETFKGVAHKYGISQKQFEGIVKDFTAINITNALENQKQMKADAESLVSEWGAAYDQNAGLVKALAVKTDAPETLMKAIEAKQVDSKTMLWLHKVATQLGGSEGVNLLDDKGGQQGLVMTPAEALEKIDEIMNNKEHAYWIASHPQHQQALDRMVELRKFANPQASTDVNDLRRGATAG